MSAKLGKARGLPIKIRNQGNADYMKLHGGRGQSY